MSSTKVIRSRGFCFTLNNYGQNDEDGMAQLISPKGAQYVIYGREKGASGTPHLQGVIYFRNQRVNASVIAFLGRGYHVEVMKGTIDQAIVYCMKEGNWVEHGVRPMSQELKGTHGPKGGKKGGEAEKYRWEQALRGAREGLDEIIPAQIMLCQYGNIQRIRQAELGKKVTNASRAKGQNMLFYGPTGTGKSLTVRDMIPPDQLYIKNANKWWDGYAHQPYVLIEEMNPALMKVLAHYVKIWTDIYTFLAEVKGAHVANCRPSMFFITTNYTPEELFAEIPNELAPFLRRFLCYHFFDQKHLGS